MSTQPQNPISLFTLLTVLFVGLKWTDHINWSWWWVLSPLWIPAVLVLGVFAGGAAAMYVEHLWRSR